MPSVDQAWIARFHDHLNLTYQNEGSQLEKLLPGVMVHRDVGAAIDHHERQSLLIANDVVNPFGQTIILNPAHSRRACVLQSSDAAVLVSDENTLRSMVNVNSSYTMTIVMALGRRADLHILNALLGSAMTAAVTVPGTPAITYGSQALPSARKIGDSNAFDLTRTIAAGVLLSKSGVPVGPGRRKMLYGPGQETDILAITQASSSDFTKNQIHDRGTINGVTWEGFDWISLADVMDIDGSTALSRMLPLASTTRSCIAFDTGSVGLSIGRPAGPPRIHERPDLQSNPIQIRQAIMMASVRVFEGGVVQVDAKEN